MKNVLFQAIWSFWSKNGIYDLNFGLAVRFLFFLILHNKMGQILHQNFIVFLIKSFIWGNLILLGHFLLFDWMWSKSSQVTVNIRYLNSRGMISCMITTGSLSSQDMIRILKQLGHDFSVKRLCCGCCVDTMWCLCLEVNIQQSVVWFCEKNSLRICYIILLEYKGPWMLKTDTLIF